MAGSDGLPAVSSGLGIVGDGVLVVAIGCAANKGTNKGTNSKLRDRPFI